MTCDDAVYLGKSFLFRNYLIDFEKTLLQTFTYKIVYFTTVLVPAIAWITFRRQPADLKLLTYFFTITLIFESLSVFSIIKGGTANWIVNIFVAIEGIILLCLLHQWGPPGLFKKLLIMAGAIYIAFWAYINFIAGSIYNFNEEQIVLKGIILIISSCHVLIYYSFSNSGKIYKEYRFWMLTGILFYFTFSLVVFASSKIILKNNKNLLGVIWPMHFWVIIIANLIFLFGFICFMRKKDYSS